jgi:hypothetical protein
MASKRDIHIVIDPNEIRGRDELLMHLINGVTKSGVHKNHKKHNNKNECRNWKRNKKNEDY